jgi:FG-GAP-like repeat
MNGREPAVCATRSGDALLSVLSGSPLKPAKLCYKNQQAFDSLWNRTSSNWPPLRQFDISASIQLTAVLYNLTRLVAATAATAALLELNASGMQTLRWQHSLAPLGQTSDPTLTPNFRSTGPGGWAAFIDLDSDGDLDFFSNQDGGLNRLNLNQGANLAIIARGVMSKTTDWATFNMFPFNDAVPVDLDLDGDLDVVAAEDAGTSGFFQIRRNWTPLLGAPSFINAQSTISGPQWAVPLTTPFGVRAIQAMDIDADGFTDLVLGSANGLNIMFNNPGIMPGSRDFNAIALLAGAPVRGLAAGDIDGDGLSDIVRASDAPTLIELGIRAITTQAAPAAAFALAPVASVVPGLLPTCATIADVDGDGLNDLLVGYRVTVFQNTFVGGGVELFLNGPAGVLTSSQYFGPLASATSIEVADLEADGIVEVVVTTEHLEFTPPSGPPNLVNPAGTRVFERPTLVGAFADLTAAWIDDDSLNFAASPHDGTAVAVADFDLDGDLDLGVSYSSDPAAGVFTNLVSQLDAPLETGIGATSIDYTFTFDFGRPNTLGFVANIAVIGLVLNQPPAYGLILPPFAGQLAVANYATATLVTNPLGGPETITFPFNFPPGFAGTQVFGQGVLVGPNGAPSLNFSSLQRTIIR